MNRDVFISYKSDEFDDANWVRSILEQNGISCWMAPSSIPGGSNYAEEIPRAIKGCKVFVLILSQKSQESKWVPKEIDQAINEGKIIMPFMIENCSLKDDFNFYLSNIQRYYAYENKVAAIRTMIFEICAVLGRPAPCAEEQETEKETTATAEAIPVEDNISETPKQNDNVPEEEEEEYDAPVEVKEQYRPAITKNTKQKNKRADKKKIRIPLIAILGAIIMAVVVIFIGVTMSSSSKVTIAGKEMSKNSTSLHMENAVFSQADINTLESMDIQAINLKSCSFPDSMYELINKKRLYSLTLDNCSVTDEKLSVIKFENQTSLSTLNISNNKDVTSIGSISNLDSNFNTLNISGTSVTDLTPVTQLENLQELNIADIGLSDISAIKDTTTIVTLDVSNNNLKNLDAISKLIYLEEFSAANNPLESFSGLGNCTILSKLDLSSTGISDISLVSASAETLQRLYLDNNNISDISPLSRLNSLTELTLDNNDISSLDALSKISSLLHLSMASNNLVSAEQLSLNTKFEYLDISDNNISGTLDLSYIDHSESSYTSLILDISGNKNLTALCLSDISVKSADISDTSVTDFSTLTSAEFISITANYSSQTDYSIIEPCVVSEIHIIGCPLDKRVALENIFRYRLNYVDEEQSSEVA